MQVQTLSHTIHAGCELLKRLNPVALKKVSVLMHVLLSLLLPSVVPLLKTDVAGGCTH
jgi:hypothetical protein